MGFVIGNKSFPSGLIVGVAGSAASSPILFPDTGGGSSTLFSMKTGGNNFTYNAQTFFDNVFYMGWNYGAGGSKIDPTKANLGWGYEFDYWNNANGGEHGMELNLDFSGPNYPTDATARARAYAFYINRDSNTAANKMNHTFIIGSTNSQSFFLITDWAGLPLWNINNVGTVSMGNGLQFSLNGSNTAQIYVTTANKSLTFKTTDTNGSTVYQIAMAANKTGFVFGSSGVVSLFQPSNNHLQTDGTFIFGAPMVLQHSANQVLVAATAITSATSFSRISAASPVTITAAPTIADGEEGQLLTILNIGANAITLQDQGTLAGSNLRLATTTVVIGPRQSIKLMFSADVNDWVQIGNLVAVI